MLHVCGITYDHVANYGSAFQAYALQTAVENTELKDGTTCEYQLIPAMAISRRNDMKHSWIVLRYACIHGFFHLKFLSFEKNRIHYVPLRSLDELPRLNQEKDAFICGSDVIWNPSFNGHLSAYYLAFATKYKFSYAPSFGIAEIDEPTFEGMKKPLLELNAISVREETGAKLISKYANCTAQVVADPVLLLKRNEWETVMALPRKKGKYIFVYRASLSKTIQDFIERLRKETGLPIVYAAVGRPKIALRCGKIFFQKPDQWLQFLHDAEYVVTNSFHATAFSVLFHKKFFTVLSGEKAKGFNVRMNDFLCTVGLEDRIYSSMPDQFDFSEIEYQHADEKIAQMRAESLEFLRDNLEKANEIKKMNNREA